MKKIVNYFKNLSETDSIGHAYLIGNVSFLECKQELEEVIGKYIFNQNIIIDNDLDIEIVEPENNNITKSQIKDLISNLGKTSQIKGKKVYIIPDCDMLSKTVYNSLLKTLEEPEENIYAFLLTNNIDGVGKTIVSRCQKVFISSVSENQSVDDSMEKAMLIVGKIEKGNLKNTILDKELKKIFLDRKINNSIIEGMITEYKNILLTSINDVKKEVIINKIIKLNELLEKSYYNYNMDLFVNKMFMDLWRVENENSSSGV